jgi:hypothetical protein
MKIANLSAAVVAATLFLAVQAFAQSTPATKQKTQEGGGLGTPCNLVADPTADPDCKNYKQRTQNLTPSPVQATQESTGQKK